MFKLYYASAIDTCVEQAFKQIEEFKILLSKYSKLDVYGAGWKDSPIIKPDCSGIYKKVITSYDLRKLRESDILLVVTDLKQFCAGTMEEFMYARTLGICTIVCVLGEEKLRNIFIESHADKIVYGIEELEKVLQDVTQY